MNFQGVVTNVADLDRSVDFYRDVLGFTVLSQQDQLAAVTAPGSDHPQVIVLREIGTTRVGGARHIGLRAFILETDTPDELERIASELDSRRLLVSRRDHSEWIAVVGRDPDGVALVVASHPGGGRITLEGWGTLDDFLYGVGE
jgi:catechol-2,3-dioxygenase